MLGVGMDRELGADCLGGFFLRCDEDEKHEWIGVCWTNLRWVFFSTERIGYFGIPPLSLSLFV